jgi:hypothetical protein
VRTKLLSLPPALPALHATSKAPTVFRARGSSKSIKPFSPSSRPAKTPSSFSPLVSLFRLPQR